MQRLDEKPDSRLVALCLKKNAAAWEELVRRHKRRVFNIAYQFVGRYDVAEDLSQELFIKIFHALDRFDADRHFVSWLTRITRNLCIDHYRRRQRERELFLQTEVEMSKVASPRRDPYAHARSAEKAAFLRSGLAELSPDLRTAVVLRDLQGFSYDEIATKLGIPEGTVKSRINRGRHELARVLRLKENHEHVMGPEPDRTGGATKQRSITKRRS